MHPFSNSDQLAPKYTPSVHTKQTNKACSDIKPTYADYVSKLKRLLLKICYKLRFKCCNDNVRLSDRQSDRQRNSDMCMYVCVCMHVRMLVNQVKSGIVRPLVHSELGKKREIAPSQLYELKNTHEKRWFVY